jgi:hypothetical protein
MMPNPSQAFTYLPITTWSENRPATLNRRISQEVSRGYRLKRGYWASEQSLYTDLAAFISCQTTTSFIKDILRAINLQRIDRMDRANDDPEHESPIWRRTSTLLINQVAGRTKDKVNKTFAAFRL